MVGEVCNIPIFKELHLKTIASPQRSTTTLGTPSKNISIELAIFSIGVDIICLLKHFEIAFVYKNCDDYAYDYVIIWLRVS